jgi:acetyl-CoA carboxylase biotin carboxylase subunit
VIEEAPAPGMSADLRAAMGAAAVKAAQAVGYVGAGTVEFIADGSKGLQPDRYWFMEMNTRLQVEHPVTEMITRVDLVQEQIRIAAGEELSIKQKDVVIDGHSIECRINAENPETFAPSPGLITDFHAPGGLGVRLDSAVYSGYRVPPYYDSLIGKLIVHAPSRREALARLRRALDEMVIGGLETTLPLHRRLVNNEDIQAGDYDIHWLEGFLKSQTP